jgi:hypothetical protein
MYQIIYQFFISSMCGVELLKFGCTNIGSLLGIICDSLLLH